MGLILQCLLYALAGCLQEVMITIYHRSINCDRKLLACSMTTLITIVSLLVVTQVTKQILASGWLSLWLVLVFALGKGFGSFITLSWWGKYAQKKTTLG